MVTITGFFCLVYPLPPGFFIITFSYSSGFEEVLTKFTYWGKNELLRRRDKLASRVFRGRDLCVLPPSFPGKLNPTLVSGSSLTCAYKLPCTSLSTDHVARSGPFPSEVSSAVWRCVTLRFPGPPAPSGAREHHLPRAQRDRAGLLVSPAVASGCGS